MKRNRKRDLIPSFNEAAEVPNGYSGEVWINKPVRRLFIKTRRGLVPVDAQCNKESQ